MILFLLKNLLLLSACVLAGVPYLLAILNFRRKTSVKRRALTNLLSNPEILRQYKDRFPSKKSLEDAENIAKDYFATYYSRSEYLSALALNFLTGSAALVFVLARVGFPALFLGTSTITFIQSAACGTAVLWALIGSYLWNCYDLIRRTSNFNLPPDAFAKMWLKLWVAAAAAGIISGGVVPALQPALGFAIGLISIPVLFEVVADKASKLLNIKTTEGDTSTKIAALQGATPDVIDALLDIDIQCTVQLAYCDPLNVMMSTNLAWVFIIDLIDQALLFNYIGPDILKIRGGGYRGCIEVATIGANLNGSPKEKLVGVSSLSNLASLLGWPESKVMDLVQTLYVDSQVNLIWNLFGGNYSMRDRSTVPDIDSELARLEASSIEAVLDRPIPTDPKG